MRPRRLTDAPQPCRWRGHASFAATHSPAARHLHQPWKSAARNVSCALPNWGIHDSSTHLSLQRDVLLDDMQAEQPVGVALPEQRCWVTQQAQAPHSLLVGHALHLLRQRCVQQLSSRSRNRRRRVAALQSNSRQRWWEVRTAAVTAGSTYDTQRTWCAVPVSAA